MSTPRFTAADFARALDPLARRLAGALRRVGIDTTKITKVAAWKVLGYPLPDKTTESFLAEIFPGIGIYARPPSGAKAEAVVAFVGGADNPAIVAARDEKTRQAVAGGIAEDETMLHNSVAILYIKADGTLEARTKSGVAVELALKSDVQECVNKFNGHRHPDPTSGFTGGPVAPLEDPPDPTPGDVSMSNPVGTTKFKAQ